MIIKINQNKTIVLLVGIFTMGFLAFDVWVYYKYGPDAISSFVSFAFQLLFATFLVSLISYCYRQKKTNGKIVFSDIKKKFYSSCFAAFFFGNLFFWPMFLIGFLLMMGAMAA